MRGRAGDRARSAHCAAREAPGMTRARAQRSARPGGARAVGAAAARCGGPPGSAPSRWWRSSPVASVLRSTDTGVVFRLADQVAMVCLGLLFAGRHPPAGAPARARGRRGRRGPQHRLAPLPALGAGAGRVVPRRRLVGAAGPARPRVPARARRAGRRRPACRGGDPRAACPARRRPRRRHPAFPGDGHAPSRRSRDGRVGPGERRSIGACCAPATTLAGRATAYGSATSCSATGW